MGKTTNTVVSDILPVALILILLFFFLETAIGKKLLSDLWSLITKGVIPSDKGSTTDTNQNNVQVDTTPSGSGGGSGSTPVIPPPDTSQTLKQSNTGSTPSSGSGGGGSPAPNSGNSGTPQVVTVTPKSRPNEIPVITTAPQPSVAEGGLLSLGKAGNISLANALSADLGATTAKETKPSTIPDNSGFISESQPQIINAIVKIPTPAPLEATPTKPTIPNPTISQNGLLADLQNGFTTLYDQITKIPNPFAVPNPFGLTNPFEATPSVRVPLPVETIVA